MRLICPNCGAQYEVPDEVIPEEGRDVQCSNCGDTWFQSHPDHPRAAEADEQAEPAEAAEDADEDTPDWVEVEDDDQEDLTATPAEETETPSRRELDPDVASVLREEASREKQARQAEKGWLETQPDLGLDGAHDDSDRRSHQARARMARLRGAATPQDDPAEDEDIDPSTRRGLLPDIDDINSTIASAQPAAREDLSARDGSKVAAPERSSGGFRRGLRLAVLLAILATAVYIFSPQIAETIPATADPLVAYVETVNGWRAQLNEAVAPLVAQVQEMIGG
ncbi:MAG: zinc-ribbon domain-containing protein [Roseovarius sp.]|uniref:zinc-ribbon domain-containing protein n=1 Tax=Roseovarius sp. TaxID=1486281 RepID=UPI0032EDD324